MPNVIITGGTRGIGRSLISKFASAGFNIATCSRNEGELKSLKSFFKKKYPSLKIFVAKCDVSKKNEIISFGAESIHQIGIPDVLINNAGLFLPGTIADEKDGDFEEQINTNLASAYHLTRTILPGMIAKKTGYIFNFCSTASIMAYTNGGSYCISKFGMLGFSRVLREEMKEHNIRVSSILPGATNTSSWEGSNLPLDRFINPDDIANLIFNFYNTPVTMNIEEILVRPFKGDII
ncbi:MAG: SDR family oxidoreductase [Bacteroidia bacterium]